MNNKPQITVSIFLKGDELEPAYISEILGIQANDSQKKGEVRGGIRPNSKTYLTKIGTWRIQVESESRTAEEMVDEILQRFAGRPEPLDKIAGVDEAYLDILILHDETKKLDGSTEFILRKDQILKSSDLGLALWVTVS